MISTERPLMVDVRDWQGPVPDSDVETWKREGVRYAIARSTTELYCRARVAQFRRLDVTVLGVYTFLLFDSRQARYADLETREEATPETPYRIASHSKLFAATAMMRLHADGRLRLDDRICDHLVVPLG